MPGTKTLELIALANQVVEHGIHFVAHADRHNRAVLDDAIDCLRILLYDFRESLIKLSEKEKSSQNHK